MRILGEDIAVETAKQAACSTFGEMVDCLRKHPEARIILVEKPDRLFRNLKDWMTLDDFDLEFTSSRAVLRGGFSHYFRANSRSLRQSIACRVYGAQAAIGFP